MTELERRRPAMSEPACTRPSLPLGSRLVSRLEPRPVVRRLLQVSARNPLNTNVDSTSAANLQEALERTRVRLRLLSYCRDALADELREQLKRDEQELEQRLESETAQ